MKMALENVPRFTAETLRAAAKQSSGRLVVPVKLRRAIKKYLREQEELNMRRKVLKLSESFDKIKGVNLQLPASFSRELVEDPLKLTKSSKRWKIDSSYGDIGLKYRDEETIAYVASRMPAVYCACYRVLSEVRRRLPGFLPARVLDFGAGTGSALWALRDVWPRSFERMNLVEPSQSMQRAGLSLIKDQKNLPLIQGYDSLITLAKKVRKSDRQHDLVIASYVLGEIPSMKDRITIVRQLWNMTQDVLILIEPGTPQGSSIISQMRSHILWMEKRKSRKKGDALNEDDKDLMINKNGVFIVAPCPHEGRCPLDNSGKYCHFVQRLERTTSQRAYKRPKGGKPLRGYEDEKFSYVVFRRGQRPREPWPLDGMTFDSLKEQRAKAKLVDIESEIEDEVESEPEDIEESEPEDEVQYESDVAEANAKSENDEDEEKEESGNADAGSGWGRIVFGPLKRGKLVEFDVCRATNREGSEGSFDHIVMTKSKNPALHHQARRSLWGDLWPF